MYPLNGDTTEHEEALALVLDLVFSPESRLAPTKPGRARYLHDTLSEGLFFACQHDRLNMVKFLAEGKYAGKLDFNYLMIDIGPKNTIPLYAAAGEGNDKALEYLLVKQRERLDIHKGSGSYVNGPTAMWIAVWHGYTSSARLLLEKGGGPVEEIDERAAPKKMDEGREDRQNDQRKKEKEHSAVGEQQDVADDGNSKEGRATDKSSGKAKQKLVITATQSTRALVRLFSEAAWTALIGKPLPDVGLEQDETDENGHVVRYVTMELEQADAAWWGELVLRKSDEELLADETDDRSLEGNDDPSDDEFLSSLLRDKRRLMQDDRPKIREESRADEVGERKLRDQE